MADDNKNWKTKYKKKMEKKYDMRPLLESEGRIPTKPKNFKEAFSKARKAGKATFYYKGLKYTTKIKGEK